MKLLKYQREALHQKLLAIYSDARLEKIKIEEAALAKRVMDYYFKDSDRSLFNRLPNGWVTFAQMLHWTRHKKSRDISAAETMRVPRELAHGDIEIDDDEIEAAWQHIHGMEEELRKGRAALWSKIRNALAQYNTVGALQEGWPEAAVLLSETAVVVNLPAIPVGELNRVIGLQPTPGAVDKPAQIKKRKRAS